MSVDGSSYADDAAGSVNSPIIGSRFSPSAPPVKHPLPSSGTEYQRRYEELPIEQAWDADHCIAMFLDIVRDDLSDPVLLKQHVQGVQLGDVGDSGRTEAPRSLKARMAPQLVRMAEEGHLSRLCAGQHLVQRIKVTFARQPKPPHSQDSVELALGRAEAAATQVYEELIGMLQLEQAAGKPLDAPAGVNAAELLGQVKGGNPTAVKATQRLVKQLHSYSLVPAFVPAFYRPCPIGLKI
ncbi:hypothetical protein V8C86DRAFT_2491380 [Haematococcus lacustris]